MISFLKFVSFDEIKGVRKNRLKFGKKFKKSGEVIEFSNNFYANILTNFDVRVP